MPRSVRSALPVCGQISAITKAIASPITTNWAMKVIVRTACFMRSNNMLARKWVAGRYAGRGMGA
jgi:hypothetical protein